jgi:hypothetical protein
VNLDGVVLDVPEVALKLGVHAVLLEAGDQGAQHPREGLDGPLELDHPPRELVGAPGDAGVAAEDLGLYLVYVVFQARHHGAVVVHEPVHNGVEDRLRPAAQEVAVSLRPVAHLAHVRGLAVPDRHHEVGPHKDVHLPELDRLGAVQVTGSPQDHKEGVAVAIELRPLVVLDGVLDRELVQPELLGHGSEFLGGPVKPDPGYPALLVAGLVGLTQGTRLDGPLAVHVDCAVHYRHLVTPLLVSAGTTPSGLLTARYEG